jgi:hypothetical protein
MKPFVARAGATCRRDDADVRSGIACFRIVPATDYGTGFGHQRRQHHTDMVGARFAINGPGDRWTVAVFGSNLTNQGYCIAQFY